MAAPKRVVQLLDGQPWRAIDAEVDHHLLAPKSPTFVEDGMGEEPTPFARVAIGRDELQMMSRIRFVRAGERETKVLLLLAQLGRGIGFRDAQVVHPKDP